MGKDIHIVWKESFQKASNNATRNWQTTYAVLKLPEIIKHAKPFDENYRCFDVKEGSQTKNRYVELIKLRHTFNSKSLEMKMQLIHAKADLRFSHRKITNFSPPRKGFGEKFPL